MPEIQNEIDRIKAGIAAAYAKISFMGGSIPDEANVDNLSDAIATIPNNKRFYFPVETSGEES